MISIPRFLRHKTNGSIARGSSVDTHSHATEGGHSSPSHHHHSSHHHHLHWQKSHSIPELVSSSGTEAVTDAHNGSGRSSTATTPPPPSPRTEISTSTSPTTTSQASRASTSTMIITPTPTSLLTPPTTPPTPQFTLLAHHAPPTWTIALLLEELGLPYTIIPVGVRGANSADLDFLGLNSVDSDMRIPALVDHSNRDLVLVETGAVVMYLVERYGQSRGAGGASGLCPQDEEGKILARQWLFFGLTDFSPAFTTATHFLYDHPQKLPTAITHATTLVHRALSTLDSALSSQSGYLVPGAQGPTYADLVCWSWGWVYESGGFPALVDGDGCGYGDEDEDEDEDEDGEDEDEERKGQGDGEAGDCWQRYPNVGRWQRRMDARESVKRVVVKWEELKLEYV